MNQRSDAETKPQKQWQESQLVAWLMACMIQSIACFLAAWTRPAPESTAPHPAWF
jgi:hypothetical protein